MTFKTTAFEMLRKPIRQRPDSEYKRVDDIEWSEVTNSPLPKGCSKPKPDLVEFHRLNIFPTHAIDALGPFLQPSTHNFSMSRLAMEIKGRNGAPSKGYSQAAYDGAIMTESGLQQQRYLGKEPEYGKTQALTIFASPDNLVIHTNHATLDNGAKYHNTEVFDTRPHTSFEKYSAARRNVRNSQESAHERSATMLNALRSHQDHATGIPTPPSTSLKTVAFSDPGGRAETPDVLGLEGQEGTSDNVEPMSKHVEATKKLKPKSKPKRRKV